MATPFTPKGEKALWRNVYDHAALLAPGDIITYTQLTTMLGYDPSEPGRSRSPIYTASRRLLKDHNRTLIVQQGSGYRVARASEHEGLARAGQRSARRKIGRAVDVSTYVDVTELTAEQRKSLDAVALVLRAQNAMLQRHDTRIGVVEKDVQRQDDRLAALEAALARQGIDVPRADVVQGEVVA